MYIGYGVPTYSPPYPSPRVGFVPLPGDINEVPLILVFNSSLKSYNFSLFYSSISHRAWHMVMTLSDPSFTTLDLLGLLASTQTSTIKGK